jgi:hypothetical protein
LQISGLADLVYVGWELPDAQLETSASARDYHDLVAQGYRWVKIDGPYACPPKEIFCLIETTRFVSY